MKTFGFWKPVIISLAVTPLALILGFLSTGGGHGDYFVAKILFPYTMLSTALFEAITDLFFLVAFIQFPLYGSILGFAGQRRRLSLFTIILAVVHMLAVVFCFVLASENFS